MRKIFKLLTLSAALTLSACVPAAIVGGGAAIGPSFAEDRSFKEIYSDGAIRTKINAIFMKEKPSLAETFSLQVLDGRVLITGRATSTLEQIDAVRLAWTVAGVVEVIDETSIGKDSAGEIASDGWVTTKLKTKLLFEKDVKSVNYAVKTMSGKVYLMGIAKNKAELNRVIRLVKDTNGVKQVVSHVRMTDARKKQRPEFYQNTAFSKHEIAEDQPISGNQTSF